MPGQRLPSATTSHPDPVAAQAIRTGVPFAPSGAQYRSERKHSMARSPRPVGFGLGLREAARNADCINTAVRLTFLCMPDPTIILALIRALVAVMRTRSLTGAARALPPDLRTLFDAGPQVTVAPATSDSPMGLLHRAVDIGQRLVPPCKKVLMAQKLPNVPAGCFATAELQVRTGIGGFGTGAQVREDCRSRILPALATKTVPVSARRALRHEDPLVQIAGNKAGQRIGIFRGALPHRLGLQPVPSSLRHAKLTSLAKRADQAHCPFTEFLKPGLLQWLCPPASAMEMFA